jgi:hypothetical protein
MGKGENDEQQVDISQDMKSKVQPFQDNSDPMVKKLEMGATVTCYKCHGEEHKFYKCPQFVKDRYGEPERGGSEWEPIKILLDGDRNSNKMDAASNTLIQHTTQVGQAHVATGVPLDLGTNTHSLPTRARSGTPNLESTDPHRSDR